MTENDIAVENAPFLMKLEENLQAEMRAEYCERLGRALQEEADRIGKTGKDGRPIKQARRIGMKLTSTFGVINIIVWAGYSQNGKQWVVPVRERWHIEEFQRMMPSLQKKLCCTAVETGSFEKAASLAREWGCDTSDDAIRACVILLGEKARNQPLSLPCRDRAGKDDSLIIMMDGWMARHRGVGWGTKRHIQGVERIHWHEIKSAIIYRLRDLAEVNRKRRAILSKHVIAMPADTDPVTFGKRVHHEAIRMGLGRAARVYVIMDGGVWLWNIFEDRFKLCACGTLDFYHASQHVHALSAALFPASKDDAKTWCATILHSLKHHSPKKLFTTLAELLANPPRQDATLIDAIEGAQEYFEQHRQHMCYADNAKTGVPIGSGSMESQCSQFQNRFKRRGQFWSKHGFACFIEIAVRHQNGEIASLWAA
jgi:hypothetical protein